MKKMPLLLLVIILISGIKELRCQDVVNSTKLNNVKFHIYKSDNKILPKKFKKLDTYNKVIALSLKTTDLEGQDLLYWNNEEYQEYRSAFRQIARFSNLQKWTDFHVQPIHYLSFDISEIRTVFWKGKLFVNGQYVRNIGLVLQNRNSRWYITYLPNEYKLFAKIIKNIKSKELLKLLSCEREMGNSILNNTVDVLCQNEGLNISRFMELFELYSYELESKELNYFYEKNN